jgi:hypothetical protein
MLVRETSDGHYTATLEIESTNPDAAKASGVDNVEQLLKVLAVYNDLFEVEISSVTANTLREINPREIATVREGNNVCVSTIFFSEHTGLIKRKDSMEFESKALSGVDRWPEHLRRGIELNYSAIKAATDDIRFLLLASALEILARKKLGSPETLLKSKLASTRYDSFNEKFEDFLRPCDFTKEEVARLRNYLLKTSKEPVAQHLIRYLKSVNIDSFTVSDATNW